MSDILARIFIKNYKNPKDPEVRKAYGTLSGAVGITVNLLLSTIKIILGILSSSVSIMADGFNNLSDAGSSIITIIGFKISSKPADREHPFGHARFEYLTSMIISFLILIVGVEMIGDAISSIFNPVYEENSISKITIILLSLSVVFKLLLGFYYRKIGILINSGALKASATDSFTDSISTFAVLACNVIVSLTGWVFIDSLVGAAISVLIIISGFKILMETKNLLIGNAPVQETVNQIKEIVSRYPEILSIHDLMVHNYGPSNFIASFHAEVNGKDDIYNLHDTIDNIERTISNELGILCTIHMDPIVIDDPIVNELLATVKSVVKNVSADLTLHDFRVVRGATHTNLIFDILIPFENKRSYEEIINDIKIEVQKIDPTYYCVITVDRG